MAQLVQFIVQHPTKKMIIYFLTCACVDFFYKVCFLCAVQILGWLEAMTIFFSFIPLGIHSVTKRQGYS